MICIIENVQTWFSLRAIYLRQWASQVVLVIKNLPANAGDIRGTDWISGKIPWRRAQQLTPVFSLRESPWTGEPDAQQSLGSIYCYYSIFPGTSLVAQLVKNPIEGLVGLHRTVQLQLLQHYRLGHRLGLL